MAELKLIITSPGQSQREMKLANSASLGRSADNTIRLEDASIARYHAMIEKRKDDFWLTDLGSQNGTMVNGVKLTSEHQLKPGDTITVGTATTVSVASAAQPQAAPASATAEASAAPAAAAPPASESVSAAPVPEKSLPLTHVAVAGFTVFGIIVMVGISLWIIKSKSNGKPEQAQTFFTPTPAVTRTSDSAPPPPPQAPTQSVVISPAVSTGVEVLVRVLAAKIAPQGNYVFDPEMTSQIAARTSDFSVDVTAQARAARLEIDRAFGNAKGMKPLLGHVLALSQSRYGQSSSGGIGLWQVPPAIAKDYLQPSEDITALNDLKRSAEIAASHLHEIMTIFEPQDFMYALACYGQPKSVAGTLNQRLQGFGANERRDFWKMVQAGVVPREGADKVIRFFAAGIVGENPRNFGLAGAVAFSEL